MTVAAPFHRPRLTGSRTLVWRSRTDLQIGLDDDAVVLAAVPRHTEDLVRLLDGHLALGVPDVAGACQRIKDAGGKVTREAGPVKGGTTVIAFVEDPDGYKIELIQGGVD